MELRSKIMIRSAKDYSSNSGKVPSVVVEDMFKDIRDQLKIHAPGRVYGPELAQGVNEIMFRQFSKSRGNGRAYSLSPIFIGQYFVDPRDPTITRPMGGAAIDHDDDSGTGACTRLPITSGVIGSAIRSGRRVYVPDTSAPGLDHVSCDPRSESTPVSELVFVAWSLPYTSENPNWTKELDGLQVPVGAFDLDFSGKDVLDDSIMGKIVRIYNKYSAALFREKTWNGQADFRPPEEMARKSRRSRS